MKGEVTAVGVDPASESSSASAVTVGVFASIGALVGVAALVTALAIEPPAIGWVGFAVVSAVVVGLGAVAMLAFPRMRASLQAPSVAPGGERRSTVRLLHERHIPATGSVGADSYWLEQGLLARERALTPVQVTQAIVPSTLSGAVSDRLTEAGAS
jgi:hypothetical protein